MGRKPVRFWIVQILSLLVVTAASLSSAAAETPRSRDEAVATGHELEQQRRQSKVSRPLHGRTATTTGTPTGPVLPGVEQLPAVSWDAIRTGRTWSS